MSLLVSNGFKQALLGGRAWASIFQYGAIQIYSGTRPTGAEDMPSSDPIATVTNGGGPWLPTSVGYGLTFIRQGPYVVGDPSQAWQLLPNDLATVGPASWWRLIAPFDTGLPSLTDCRIDGDIGLQSAPAGQELLLPSTTLTTGTAIPLRYFFYTIPPLPGL